LHEICTLGAHFFLGELLTMRLRATRAAAACAALAPLGCGGAQSALDPAGPAAQRIADLFWWMSGGAVVIWLAVVGLAVYAIYIRRETESARQLRWLILGGGVVFPTLTLTVLLAYGLSMLPDLLAAAPAGSLRVHVTGEQWWWRVRYAPASGAPVELANEIRLPVGAPVEFQLDSADVIHSFWIPSLGGKMDMIPGRTTRLVLHPTRTGVFRGACAEYCGSSHAYMSFAVVVQPADAFDAWLAEQRQPARPAREPLAAAGQEIFLSSGCGACHAVRGTPADGVIGPDLTHVGGRLTVAAGRLDNTPGALRGWIARADRLKPSVHMPAFGMLPADELDALGAYLESLR
jgi:cytochrome c oxidase subunit 2